MNPWNLRPNSFACPDLFEVGEQIDGWRVCWLGGWDKARIFFFVMVFRHGGAKR